MMSGSHSIVLAILKWKCTGQRRLRVDWGSRWVRSFQLPMTSAIAVWATKMLCEVLSKAQGARSVRQHHRRFGDDNCGRAKKNSFQSCHPGFDLQRGRRVQGQP